MSWVETKPMTCPSDWRKCAEWPRSVPTGPGVSKLAYGAKNAKNQPIDPVEKNSQILIEYPSRNKESNKKMVSNSKLGWGRND